MAIGFDHLTIGRHDRQFGALEDEVIARTAQLRARERELRHAASHTRCNQQSGADRERGPERHAHGARP
jgi:hypothetical protein